MSTVPTVDQLAVEIMAAICKRVNVTIPQRHDFEKFIANKVRPYVEQPGLFAGAITVDDEQAFEAQADAILALLKKRRSQGATNAELSALSLKYTGRVSDLRKLGHRITCKRDGDSRTYRYILGVESW